MNRTAFEIALASRNIHTTVDLSERVGISRQTLTPIRHGLKEATPEVAEQIRNSLKLTDYEYKTIFPLQAEITAARERYAKGV